MTDLPTTPHNAASLTWVMTWSGNVWHATADGKLVCGVKPKPRPISWPAFWQTAHYSEIHKAPVTKLCTRCGRLTGV